MNKQDKTPMVTKEVVKPSLNTIRRDVEKEEKREDAEAAAQHSKAKNS